MTPMEQKLYDALQADEYLRDRFKPQHWVLGGKRRLDFACVELNYAVEADDYGTHGTAGGMESDYIRDRQLRFEGGWWPDHYSYFQIANNLPWVIESIKRSVRRLEALTVKPRRRPATKRRITPGQGSLGLEVA